MQLRTQQCQSPCSTTASQLPAPCTSHYRRHRHRQRSLYVCAVDKSGGSEVGVTEAQPTTTLQPPASPQATSSSFAEPPSQQSLEAVQLPMTVRTLKNGPPGLEGAVLRGADIFLRSLRRLKWQNLKPRALAINLLFVLVSRAGRTQHTAWDTSAGARQHPTTHRIGLAKRQALPLPQRMPGRLQQLAEHPQGPALGAERSL